MTKPVYRGAGEENGSHKRVEKEYAGERRMHGKRSGMREGTVEGGAGVCQCIGKEGDRTTNVSA
jgi:hypothetical protein